ncbi:MAG TPA: NUDIX domain-containing protein [Chloroflexi bacterium]|nr:NUDIX domain-containing protein [Chloroflexota bacterium]
MFENLSSLPLAQRWRGQKYPMASVLALIQRNSNDGESRWLLIKRQVEPFAGKWALVGGKWDFGETLERTVAREVKEETGLVADFVALRGVVSERVAPRSAKDEGGHFLLFVCQLHAPNGEASEQYEGPVVWFSPAELKELRAREAIISTDYTLLKQFGLSDSSLTYVEADVIASQSGASPDELVRFEEG